MIYTNLSEKKLKEIIDIDITIYDYYLDESKRISVKKEDIEKKLILISSILDYSVSDIEDILYSLKLISLQRDLK